MTQKEITANGLSAKDAAEVVKIASGFKADITIASGNKTVNAKSLMGIIALGLKTPQKIRINADGADESEAVKSLVKFVEAVR